jgi:hypothetical protein
MDSETWEECAFHAMRIDLQMDYAQTNRLFKRIKITIVCPWSGSFHNWLLADSFFRVDFALLQD